MNRRKFLVATGALAATSTAGCSDTPNSSGNGNSSATGGDGGGSDSDASGGGSDPSTTTAGGTSTPDDESTSADTGTGSPTDSERAGNQTTTVPIGEVVQGDQMSMVVRGMSEQAEIGDFQEAGSGNTFAIVNLAVKNTTDSKFIGFSGFLRTQIKDSEDYTYDRTVAATGETFEGGQLAPGEVSRGDLVYEIPDDASGLALQFDFQTFSFLDFERVNVNLGKTASSIADLTQSLRVDTHSVDDEVSYEDVSVAVNGVEYQQSIGSFAEADDGNEFAIVDISTTNNTGEELSISTLLQMKMKDGTGTPYELSLAALSALDQSYDESQPLASGESRRGKVPYEGPKGASPLYWIFEFTLWVDGDKTFWEIR
ncbi:DUF4352 domain-containing protein [Halosimplex sp. TS25]|uniref:DUF4352 domain-containing protein n=1 Tax=Halosimplex rarum TaxID=3396619 RepID=UPI0039ED0403